MRISWISLVFVPGLVKISQDESGLVGLVMFCTDCITTWIHMRMRLASMLEGMHAFFFAARTAHAQREPRRQAHKQTHTLISYGPRDGGASTSQVIRNVLADEAAVVHVVGDALRIRRHAHSGRHC